MTSSDRCCCCGGRCPSRSSSSPPSWPLNFFPPRFLQEVRTREWGLGAAFDLWLSSAQLLTAIPPVLSPLSSRCCAFYCTFIAPPIFAPNERGPSVLLVRPTDPPIVNTGNNEQDSELILGSRKVDRCIGRRQQRQTIPVITLPVLLRMLPPSQTNQPTNERTDEPPLSKLSIKIATAPQ